MRAAGGLVLALLGGCGSPAPLALSVPPHPTARALLLGIERADAIELRAIELSQPAEIPTFDYAGDGPITLTALYYRETLELLDLDAGPLERAQPSDPNGRPIRPFAAARVLSLDETVLDGAPSDRWVEAAALPASLAAFSLRGRGPSPCRELRASTFRIGDRGGAVAVLPYGAGAVLVVRGPEPLGEPPALIRATATGTSALPALPPGFLPLAGAVDSMSGDSSAGEIWLAGGSEGAGGQVYRGDPARGFRRVSDSRDPRAERVWLRAVAISRTGTRTLAYLNGDGGTFERYDADADRWTLLVPINRALLARVGDASAASQGLTAIPGGGVFGVRPHVPEATEREILSDGPGGFMRRTTGLPINIPAQAGRIGAVFGLDDGDVGIYAGGEVTRLPERPARAHPVDAMIALEDGFAIGGFEDDRLIEYHTATGYCPPSPRTGLRTITAIARLGAGYVVGGQPRSGQAPTITVLTRD